MGFRTGDCCWFFAGEDLTGDVLSGEDFFGEGDWGIWTGDDRVCAIVFWVRVICGDVSRWVASCMTFVVCSSLAVVNVVVGDCSTLLFVGLWCPWPAGEPWIDVLSIAGEDVFIIWSCE